MTNFVILEPRAIGCQEFCYIESKPERFSNFQKTSSEKKFETCGLRNLGKLIIVACWIQLKGRQLLTEARLTKTPSVSSRPRQIAKISLFLDKLTTSTTICFAVGFVLWTYRNTSMKKNVFFRALLKWGGAVYPCPNFLALLQDVHFWSIKRVYFSKNANALNF